MAALQAVAVSARERAVIDALEPNLLIGSWRPASEDRRFSVHDPATGTELTQVADASVEDALAALDAADRAQPTWAALPAAARAEILHTAYAALVARTEEMALLITLEMGKPLEESRAEVAYGAGYLRWYAEEAVRVGGRTSESPDGRSTILTSREPVGPCLLITPWNFPLAMGLRKIAPALAVGCTVVLKPASATPLASLAFAQILIEAGMPPGVLNVIPSRRSGEVSAALMTDPRLRKVSFTGSTEVGQTLIEQSAANVMRTSMELGGNAPLLVFDDADLARAVEGATVAKLRNGGQSCVAANRILVQDGIADAFVERFTERIAATVLGRGTEPGVTLGPVIDPRAVGDITALVDEAVAAGAQLLTGGVAPDGEGSFYPATVLDRVPAGARVLNEEIFGPVAPIVRFATEAEGIELANETRFGLVAYLFSEDVDRVARVSRALEVGMVGVNQGLVSNVAAPFGGIKHSGIGREGGAEGLEEYLQVKYVAQAAPRPEAPHPAQSRPDPLPA